MSRPTFAGWKRRIEVGTQLLCIEQTYQPKLVGQTRTVKRVMTVGVVCEPNFWTHWPKAQQVTMVDSDTARWSIFPEETDKVMALRILPKGRAVGGYRFCIGCGSDFEDDAAALAEHLCQFPDDESFCGHCGAELTDNKSCDNDHSEEA